MTVISQRTTHRYVGDGVQNSWPILFKFLEPEHVKALKTSVEGVTTPLVYGSEYTVAALEGGGQCSVQLEDGEQITLFLDVPLTQETDLRDAGRLAPEVLERMADKLTLALQQQKTDIERCVKVPPESAETPDNYVQQILLVKEQTRQFKNAAQAAVNDTLVNKEESKEQVDFAIAEVAKAQSSVTEASQVLTEIQAELSHLDETVRGTIQTEMVPVVQQSKSELNVIKAQVVSYRDDSARQVVLASDEVKKAETVVDNAEQLVSDARALITSAQQLIDDATSGNISEMLSGMVIPFKGQVSERGFPRNRMTGAEDMNFALCDGRTYTAPDGAHVSTPDLRDRFLVGAGLQYVQGGTGGVDRVALSANQMPAHAHAFRACTNDDSGSYTFNDFATVTRAKTQYRTVTVAGGSEAHENRPPYYALAYLMKL